jgi:hypothetical protein
MKNVRYGWKVVEMDENLLQWMKIPPTVYSDFGAVLVKLGVCIYGMMGQDNPDSLNSR